MLSWFSTGRRRRAPNEQQQRSFGSFETRFHSSRHDNCSGNDDRKRKALTSFGAENEKQRGAVGQDIPCCGMTSTLDLSNDVHTPTKRICCVGTIGQATPQSSDAAKIPGSTSSITTCCNAVTPQSESTHQSARCYDEDIQDLLWKEAKYNSTGTDVTLKRSDYLVWDDFFMGIAKLSAMRSKDPEAPFSGGACIVDEENRVIGIGYHGFPRDCSDDCLPWWSNIAGNGDNHNEDKPGQPWLHTQTPYVCHAEVNAILNKCSANVEGARLYVARFPCHDCAKVIIQSRIKEVVYIDDSEHDTNSCRASRILFTMAGVIMRQYQPIRTSILLDFAAVMAPGNMNTDEVETKADFLDLPNVADDAATTRFRELILEEAGYDPVTMASGKRTVGVLSWDDWFMAVAFLAAKRSKDPNTQVGACIVDRNKRIVGLGYNGFPRGCSDDYLPWARTAPSPLHTKYLYVCHAEVNAILNKGSSDVKGASLYVALFPCNDCAKVIIQAGIREVVYLSDQYHETDSCRASRIMFAMAGVKLRQHIPSVPTIVIDLCDDEKN